MVVAAGSLRDRTILTAPSPSGSMATENMSRLALTMPGLSEASDSGKPSTPMTNRFDSGSISNTAVDVPPASASRPTSLSAVAIRTWSASSNPMAAAISRPRWRMRNTSSPLAIS